jgi:3-oxoacyl-[acyl-carrier protein] reductase
MNVASEAVHDGGGRGALAYATSDGVPLTFIRVLAKEMGPRRIRVDGIVQETMNTDFWFCTNAEVYARVAASAPPGCDGEAEQVADLVIFVASNHASFIMGQIST